MDWSEINSQNFKLHHSSLYGILKFFESRMNGRRGKLDKGVDESVLNQVGLSIDKGAWFIFKKIHPKYKASGVVIVKKSTSA